MDKTNKRKILKKSKSKKINRKRRTIRRKIMPGGANSIQNSIINNYNLTIINPISYGFFNNPDNFWFTPKFNTILNNDPIKPISIKINGSYVNNVIIVDGKDIYFSLRKIFTLFSGYFANDLYYKSRNNVLSVNDIHTNDIVVQPNSYILSGNEIVMNPDTYQKLQPDNSVFIALQTWRKNAIIEYNAKEAVMNAVI
jgi:hypothetical protein